VIVSVFLPQHRCHRRCRNISSSGCRCAPPPLHSFTVLEGLTEKVFSKGLPSWRPRAIVVANKKVVEVHPIEQPRQASDIPCKPRCVDYNPTDFSHQTAGIKQQELQPPVGVSARLLRRKKKILLSAFGLASWKWLRTSTPEGNWAKQAYKRSQDAWPAVGGDWQTGWIAWTKRETMSQFEYIFKYIIIGMNRPKKCRNFVCIDVQYV
jgi:hypothetical protein